VYAYVDCGFIRAIFRYIIFHGCREEIEKRRD
jgi:hypothetical protein